MIEELIRKVAGRLIHIINFEAEVLSYDEETDTCVVKTPEDVEIDGVKLKSIVSDESSKFVSYPTVGSYVTCSILNNMPDECYVTQYSQIDKVVLNCEQVIINGGQNGGLVNWPSAKAQLDLVAQFIEVFKNNLSIPVNEPGNGAPSAFQQALNTALTSIQTANFNDLEDTIVKH
jgi:hypothetical protein